MRYIKDIDELIIPPPYRLGTGGTNHQFEAHDFILESGDGALRDLVDKHLNAAFERSNGQRRKARKRTRQEPDSGFVDLEYRVLPDAPTILSFIRYGRVDALDDEERGAMAYTEVILSCQLLRYVGGTQDQSVPLDFIGLVYIDDREFSGGKMRDALDLPIVFGRELFGMPKAPGEICYEPNGHDYQRPMLKIWDRVDPQGGFLRQVPAIRFKPDIPDPDADQQPDYRPSPIALGPARGEPKIDRMLVGLKQFADPIVVGDELQACYQAIVETPLQTYSLDGLEINVAGRGEEIEFPDVSRVKIVEKFGLKTKPGFPHRVTSGDIYHRSGRMIFADPKLTIVWELEP